MSRYRTPRRRPRSTLRHAVVAVAAIVVLSAVAASTQAFATADETGGAAPPVVSVAISAAGH